MFFTVVLSEVWESIIYHIYITILQFHALLESLCPCFQVLDTSFFLWEVKTSMWTAEWKNESPQRERERKRERERRCESQF